MKDHQCNKTPSIYKEVVVIGNGPSGLAMSYILSGKCPTYNGSKHPESMLTMMLTDLGTGRSLFEADLNFMAQSLEGSGSPVGVLMDKMIRPGADLGLDLPSLVDWRCHKSLDHIVIGKGPPGGAWQSMEGETLTLSLSSWMELPGLRFSDCPSIFDPKDSPKRIKASSVARYYIEYVKRMSLQKYQRRGQVTSITICDNVIDNENEDKKINWKIEGRDANGTKFLYHSRFVVLASGTYDIPNRLKVQGEDNAWVAHDLSALERILEDEDSDSNGVILVVGAGLSAADAVMAARFRQRKVYHVFRKAKTPLERNLPSSVYPEYHKVFQMMSSLGPDDESYPGYTPFPGRKIIGFEERNTGRWVRLEQTKEDKSEELKIGAAAVLIGSTADLRYTNRDNLGRSPGPVNSRGNSVSTDPATSEVDGLPNCFALGSLAGDNFVRNITGSAILAASQIYKSQ